jgi:hypothetical protein
MRLAIMTSSTNALKVLPFCPLRVINPNERNDVVYVISSRIVAHLAHRVGLSLQQANAFPFTTVTPALL